MSKSDEKKSGAKNNFFSPLKVNNATFVPLIIILASLVLFYFTFQFDLVPPILNRGIQPATFPKILLVIIIGLSCIMFISSTKNKWEGKQVLPKTFWLTIVCLLVFTIIAKILDFFLGLAVLSFLISILWGERRIAFLVFVAIVFPALVFLFFDKLLNLRFPGGILTNIYYY